MTTRRLRTTVTVALALSTVAAGLGASAADGARPAGADYSAAVLADQPYLYWRLDETTGTIAHDVSGNNRDGTFDGAPKLAVRGLIKDDPDTAFHVYGGSGASWTPTQDALAGAYTVEAWARPVRTNRDLTVVSTRTNEGARSFDMKFSTFMGHGIRVDVGDGQQWLMTSTLAFDWQYRHTYLLDLTVNPHSATLLVNGAMVTRQYFDCQPGHCTKPLLTDATDPIQVGYNEGHIERMRGPIDEVAIYSTNLSRDQVAAHYAAGT